MVPKIVFGKVTRSPLFGSISTTVRIGEIVKAGAGRGSTARAGRVGVFETTSTLLSRCSQEISRVERSLGEMESTSMAVLIMRGRGDGVLGAMMMALMM